MTKQGSPTQNEYDDTLRLYTIRFPIMGGPGSLRFTFEGDAKSAEAVARDAIAEGHRIERKFSRFLPGSTISIINRAAGRGAVAIDEEAVRLIETALDLARETEGAFDPTAGVLRRGWDFRAKVPPDANTLNDLLRLVDYDKVKLRNGTAKLVQEGMELDLGGVGKEYAVDRMIGRLAESGVKAALVELAGDVATYGSRGDGKPWKISIAHPRKPGQHLFSVRLLAAGGVCTSGDYERCFFHNGKRYHHLLDARTGMPAQGLSASTAVANTASEAGTAATAAFLLGPNEGIRLLASRNGVEGALVTPTGGIVTTEAFHRYSDLPGSLYENLPLL